MSQRALTALLSKALVPLLWHHHTAALFSFLEVSTKQQSAFFFFLKDDTNRRLNRLFFLRFVHRLYLTIPQGRA